MGAVFAVNGHVLDTRRVEYREGPFAHRELASGASGGDQVFAEFEALPSGTLEITWGDIRRRARGRVFVSPPDGETLSWGTRTYGGDMYVVPMGPNTLSLVLSEDVESLLRGVVPAEIFASAAPAALEAQAIVARGAILSLLAHRHHDAPFHLCSEQHCQVYRGLGGAHPATDAAIRATRGLVAVAARPAPGESIALVESVYSANCGGHTEANEVAWAQAPSSSLRPRLDGPAGDDALASFREGITESNVEAWVASPPPTYCARASLSRPDKFRWETVLEGESWQNVVQTLGMGPILEISVQGRGRGGRVTGVRIRGRKGEVTLERELTIRRAFGGLKSGAFVLKTETGADGTIVRASFRGAGWGHGVGMCQMGAIGRAEAGQSAAEILRFYYSGAVLHRLYD